MPHRPPDEEGSKAADIDLLGKAGSLYAGTRLLPFQGGDCLLVKPNMFHDGEGEHSFLRMRLNLAARGDHCTATAIDNREVLGMILMRISVVGQHSCFDVTFSYEVSPEINLGMQPLGGQQVVGPIDLDNFKTAIFVVFEVKHDQVTDKIPGKTGIFSKEFLRHRNRSPLCYGCPAP